MNDLSKLVLAGDFEKANILERKLSSEEVHSYIMSGAMASESVMFYLYYLNKLIKRESAEDHYKASLILSQALNHLEGSYDQALYHAKRAIQLDEYNMGYKEYYLLFYKQPDLILSAPEEDFIKCCDDLLEFNNNHTTAKIIKEELMN